MPQSQGEEKDESAKEAPIKGRVFKRKTKTPPTSQPSPKKVVIQTPKKPTTRATTRASTQKAKEEATKKKKTKAQEEPKKRKRYVAQPDIDEEDQIEEVSPPKSSIDILCKKIRNGDINEMKKIDYNKFSKEEQNSIEESVYAFMAQFKYTPLELDGQMTKELSKIIEDKWNFYLMMEKEMRESTLENLLPDLTKE